MPALYDRVAVPPSVCEELGRLRAPEAVRTWIAQSPSWLEILTPTNSPDTGLAHLDAGERDAMLLAEELAADQIVIDEIRGRREAQRRHSITVSKRLSLGLRMPVDYSSSPRLPASTPAPFVRVRRPKEAIRWY